MALTPASILADYSSGIGTQGATLKVDANNERVGIGTTNPQGTLQVGTAITMGSGIITATSFDGNTATFSGNVSVGGTLTYEDVTSVDSVGIITARSTINAQGNVTVGAGLSVVGVSTFNGITTSTTTLFANNFSVSGVSTLGGNVVVGGATTELVVTGDARVTGILTVGTASLTLDGATGNVTGASLHDTQISAINTSIVGTGTTVDVFVYDTRKDSDGGAWRHRTQHTSWYKETLNTATRGSRREFPAVAVIVAEATKVTIYDGDDPDLPMWMEFDAGEQTANGKMLQFWGTATTGTVSSVAMLNGVMVVGTNNGSEQGRYVGMTAVNFVSDSAYFRRSFSDQYIIIGNTILDRNVNQYGSYAATGGLVGGNANDLAMTVLPNAPIDSATGLPIPTIAVATDGGASIIKDDGNIFNYTFSSQNGSKVWEITFDENHQVNMLLGYSNNYPYVSYQAPVPSADTALTSTTNHRLLSNSTFNFLQIAYKADNTPGDLIDHFIDSKYFGTTHGLSFLTPDRNNIGGQMLANITTEFNSGWMHGDIKGAFLSDTDATNVSAVVVNASTGDWSQQGEYNWTITSATEITVSSVPSGQGAILRLTTDSSKHYVYSFNVTSVSDNVTFRDDQNADIENPIPSSTGVYTGSFTGTSYVDFTVYQNDSATITGIDIREAEEDRSVNNNGLGIYGTVTKSAVATGADLVAYSGFSASNYLLQPYNSSLGIDSTDSLTITCWTKASNSDSGLEIIFGTGELSTGRGRYLYLSNGIPYLDTYGGASQQTTQEIDDGNWHHLVGIYTPNGGFVYVDGRLVATPVFHVGYLDQTGTSWSSTIGLSSTNSDPYDNGSIALLRISNSVPSAEQVKKMYEDEKVLFQENSQATLYGSSDAVTALGFDEDTNLLHVGTSSGRSDFQGLRRINNTTTAVTTAISASNGLVAEE